MSLDMGWVGLGWVVLGLWTDLPCRCANFIGSSWNECMHLEVQTEDIGQALSATPLQPTWRRRAAGMKSASWGQPLCVFSYGGSMGLGAQFRSSMPSVS
jgi:hypothetical protein